MSVHVATPPPGARSKDWKRRWLTGGSLVGLLAGCALGIVAHRSASPWLLEMSSALAPIGTAWPTRCA